jgi:hypothetical protein
LFSSAKLGVVGTLRIGDCTAVGTCCDALERFMLTRAAGLRSASASASSSGLSSHRTAPKELMIAAAMARSTRNTIRQSAAIHSNGSQQQEIVMVRSAVVEPRPARWHQPPQNCVRRYAGRVRRGTNEVTDTDKQ